MGQLVLRRSCSPPWRGPAGRPCRSCSQPNTWYFWAVLSGPACKACWFLHSCIDHAQPVFLRWPTRSRLARWAQEVEATTRRNGGADSRRERREERRLRHRPDVGHVGRNRPHMELGGKINGIIVGGGLLSGFAVKGGNLDSVDS